MPLISFEGVDVDVPSVEGLRFFFEDGKLAIQCTNFTGTFSMAKMAVGGTATSNAFTTPEAPKFAETKKRASTEVTPVVDVFEEVKRQKVDVISPDEKQPNLTKAIQFLESEKENIFNSEDEMELLLTQRETTLDDEKLSKTKPAAKRAPLKQLSPSQDKKAAAKSKSQSKKSASKKESKKSTVPQSAKINFFAPKVADTKVVEEDIQSSSSDVEIVHASGSSISQEPFSPFRTGTVATITVAGTPPSQRWGCTATKVSNDRIVVYGGEGEDEATLSDLFVYDIAKKEWSRPLNCESIPRTWHGSVFLEHKNLMLVFGGERTLDGGQETLSDLMVLDTECFLWYPPAVSGTPPMARSGHSCAVMGKDVIVFGGTRGRTRLSTVHLLDTETWNWRNIKVNGKAPTARTYHSAVAMGNNRMVIFGGNDSKKSYDSVHVLERSDNDTWSWFNPCVVGQGPEARTGQVAVGLNDRTIIIHGGWDPQNAEKISLYGDVFTLDTETWEWSAIVMDTEVNELRRVGHVGVKTSDNTLLLFGGQDAAEARLNQVTEICLH